MRRRATLLMTQYVTHDVKRFILSKPAGLKWRPGQGVLVALNKPGLKQDEHPFTPTSLPGDGVLEFIIKRYPARRGMTASLHALKPGAQLLLGEVFGDIRYKGPGLFIAAGAGITPFLGILRTLHRQGKLAGNRLIFSNKTAQDVILENELCGFLGERCICTLTRERRAGYERHRVDEAFLRRYIESLRRCCYLCGPEQFIWDVRQALMNLGVQPDRIIYDEP